MPDPVAVAAAMTLLDDHIAALNAHDEAALVATLHFPRYRLSGRRMRVWIVSNVDGRWAAQARSSFAA